MFMQSLLRHIRHWIIPVILYLALACYQIYLPGPNYDEAIEAQPAVQFLQQKPVEIHREVGIPVGNRRLPLMVNVDYVGALNTYALLILFKIGGINVAVMRLWPIFVGVIILWLTYQLGTKWGGQRVGWMATWLLALQPSFVFFMRQGIFVTNTTIAFMLGVWLTLLKWVETNKPYWFWLAAWLAGMGLWAKFIMLWPLVATLLIAPLFWRFRNEWRIKPHTHFDPRSILHPRLWVPAALTFLLGLSPFILYNLQTGATFQFFLQHLNRTYYGFENSLYLSNLLERWSQIRHFLRGDHFWYLGGNFVDILAWPSFLLGFLFLIATSVRGRRYPVLRRWALRGWMAYVLFLFLLLQAPLTPTGLWYTHLAIFSPVLVLASSLGWNAFFSWFPNNWSKLLATTFVVFLSMSSLRADIQYHRILTVTGGLGDHSDALYRLSDELLNIGIEKPYALDWGFEAPVILLTQGKINPIGVFNYEPFDRPDDAFDERMRPLLQDKHAIFIVHSPERTNFPGRREALQQLARSMGIRLKVLAAITERSGKPHSEIWQPITEPPQ